MIKRHHTWNAVALATALLGSACAGDESPELIGHVAENDQAVLNGPQDTTAPQPLVTISDSAGRIEWLPPELPGEEPEIVITVSGQATPIILPDMVERVGTVQAYFAVAAEGQPLPSALLPFVREDDRAVMNDRTMQQALRDENQRLRLEFERELAAAGDQPGTAASCSAAQKNHAQTAYGAAYSAGGGSAGSKTCGQSMAVHSTDGTTYYCNIPNADCDYGLGGSNASQCAAAGGAECDPDCCTTVRGRTRALRARMQVAAGGNAWFAHYGQRYRFGFKNCSDTYSATMRRRRGAGDWIYTTILPNQMQIRVGGGAYPPPYALARNVVAWGVWEEHHDWSTNADPINKVEMTAQTEGLLCGDIIQRFDTYDFPTGWCNGGTPLCDDNTCTGSGSEAGCWD